jgi:hypothetical protein
MSRERLQVQGPELGLSVLDAMKSFLGTHGCADRCGPLVDMISELCGMKEFVRCLPDSTVRGMLKELLKRLDSFGWTRRLDDGSQVLRKINLACVMLLNHLQKGVACSLLLDLGLREADTISASLVSKCMRKMHKGLSTPDATHRILDVLRDFLQPKRESRLSGGSADLGSDAFEALLPTVREFAEAAANAFPDATLAWRHQQCLPGEIAVVLDDYLGIRTGVNGDIKMCA